MLSRRSAESETVVENELYRITFTNRGGAVKSWLLKKYKDDTPEEAAGSGQPRGGGKFRAPALAVHLRRGPEEPAEFVAVCAVGDGNGQRSRHGIEDAHVRLFVRRPDRPQDLSLRSSYVIRADVSVTQNGAPVTALLILAFRARRSEHAAATMRQRRSTPRRSGKTDELAAKKVVGGDTLRGSFDYAGVSDLYFAAIFMPTSPADTAS